MNFFGDTNWECDFDEGLKLLSIEVKKCIRRRRSRELYSAFLNLNEVDSNHSIEEVGDDSSFFVKVPAERKQSPFEKAELTSAVLASMLTAEVKDKDRKVIITVRLLDDSNFYILKSILPLFNL